MFESHATMRNVDYIKLHYNIENFHTQLDEYTEDLNKRRTKYYLCYYFSNTMRFFQSLSALGVTILTTKNNPYMNDYEERINIYLWYLAMFTTLVNFTLESSNNCYDIKNNKIINELLRMESFKLRDKKIPYDDVTHPNNNNKVSCFITAVKQIGTYNSSDPIIGLSKLYDRSTTPYTPRVNNYTNEGNSNEENSNDENTINTMDDMPLYKRLLTYFN